MGYSAPATRPEKRRRNQHNASLGARKHRPIPPTRRAAAGPPPVACLPRTCHDIAIPHAMFFSRSGATTGTDQLECTSSIRNLHCCCHGCSRPSPLLGAGGRKVWGKQQARSIGLVLRAFCIRRSTKSAARIVNPNSLACHGSMPRSLARMWQKRKLAAPPGARRLGRSVPPFAASAKKQQAMDGVFDRRGAHARPRRGQEGSRGQGRRAGRGAEERCQFHCLFSELSLIQEAGVQSPFLNFFFSKAEGKTAWMGAWTKPPRAGWRRQRERFPVSSLLE
ncbi:hypothetical protein QBC39DRAFT_358335 [Podospora conica]|nr:hypothetical protein QBC39DRAFT_358335 [Schizothecium conicum]